MNPNPTLLQSKSAILSAERLAEKERERPIVVQATVESVLDGRQVGYGTATYVEEKNKFELLRKNRMRGVLDNV